MTPDWLPLLLVPALWLMYLAYRYRVRASQEQRVWRAVAHTTRALGGPVEGDVAAAAVRGALDVFTALRAELAVRQPDGSHRRYAGDDGAEVVELPPSAPATALSRHVLTRTMTVDGTPLGELTVWLAAAPPRVIRDGSVLAALGDALTDALYAGVVRRRQIAEAEHEAAHDPLTGLSNRATLLARGDRILRDLERSHPVALLRLDLNDFKQVNGTLGQDAGDALLTVVGERLAHLIRHDELLARLGDDEFAVFLPNAAVLTDSSAPAGPVAALPQAVRRARELVDRVATPTEIAGVRLVTEVAVGVAVAKAACCDMEELIRRAGIAMDKAKHAGVGVMSFDDGDDAASTEHLALLAELRDALTVSDQLVLALQPAVDLSTGAPTGVEALTRWQHPRRGRLLPGDFLRIVEHSELLAPFTRYVLDHSLAAAADWSAAGMELPVSVNVSARSLLDVSFPAQVADALRRHRMPAHRLVLEITETVAVSDDTVVDEVVAALRSIGVQLSVDDFGTGYSSLSFLTRVPVDELKVDRSFVSAMTDSVEAAAIVHSAVELGRRLNLRVVAEGVETADQRAALVALGCTAAQGYHFCQPLPADTVIGALRSLAGTTPARILPLRADGAS